MIVYFGYTSCPDICPTSLSTISEALAMLGDGTKDIQPVFISIDPDRDTPRQLADYVGLFHFNLIGLTGSADQIAKAAKAYQVRYSVGDVGGERVVDHTTRMYLMGPDGSAADAFDFGITAEDLAPRLRKAIEARKVVAGR